MRTCFTCKKDFYDWNELNAHLQREHNNFKYARSGRSSSRNERYTRTDGFNGTWSDRKAETPKTDSTKPVQIQIIEFFESLLRKQSLGFEGGEVAAMFEIAKKKVGTS